MAKRVNKNMVAGLTAFAFVLMTTAGILMVLSLRDVDPQTFVDLATEAETREEWREAQHFYSKAYQVSKDEIYLVRVGEMIYQGGDERRAQLIWQKALTQDPQLVPALEKLLRHAYEYVQAVGSEGNWRTVKERAEDLLAVEDQHTLGLLCKGRALLALQQEDPSYQEQGLEALHRVLELDPKNVDAALELALAEGREDQTDLSDTLFEKLIAANSEPGHDASVIRRVYGRYLATEAAVAKQEGREEEARELDQHAVQQLRKAVELAGDDPEDQAQARVFLAEYRVFHDLNPVLGDPERKEAADRVFEEVAALLEEAIEIQPEGFDHYRLLAELHRGVGERKKAIEVAERRMQLDVDRRGFRGRQRKRALFTLLLQAADQSLAVVGELKEGSEERKKYIAKAARFVREAQAEVPDHARAIHTEGKVLLVQGKDLEALAKFEKADEASARPFWENKFYMANLYLLNGELGAARNAIRVAVQDPRASPAAWYTYARVALQGDDPQTALQAAGRVLEVQPDHRRALLAMAEAYRKLGRTNMVEETLARLKSEDPENQVVQARALIGQERYEAAAALLEPLAEENPADWGVVGNLLRVYREQDDLDKARTLLTRSIDADPNDVRFRKVLLGLEEGLTPEERDERFLTMISELGDEYVRSWELAKYHLAKQHWDKAREELRNVEHLLETRGTEKAAEDAARLGPLALRDVIDRRFVIACNQEDWEAAEEIATQAAKDNLDGADGLTFFGRLHLFKGEPAKAVNEFRQALEKQPSNSDTYTVLGQAFMDLRQLEEAKDALNKAVDLNPNNGLAHKGLALLAKEQKDISTLNRHFGECLRLIPDDAWVQQAQRELERLQEPEKVIAKLETELEDNPEDVSTLLELASLYSRTDQKPKARECYTKVLEASPGSLPVAQRAVEFFDANGEPERSEELIRNLIEEQEEPKLKGAAYLMLATHFVRIGDIERADSAYLAAAEAHEGLEICRMIGRHFFSTGRPAMAVDWLEKALKIARREEHPGLRKLESMHVEATLKSGDHEKAMEGVENLLREYPAAGNPGLMFRAEIEASAGRLEDAIKSLSQYLEGATTGRELALFRRARYLAILGKWGLAVSDLEKLKAADPKALQFEPRKWLARAYDRTGKFDLAAGELESLFAENPDNNSIGAMLLQLYLDHDALDQAERVVQSVLNRRPTDPYWSYQKGQISLQRALKAEAESTTRRRYSDRALEDMSRSAQLAGFQPQAVSAVMDACRALERPDFGIEFFEKSLTPEQRNPAAMRDYASLLAAKGMTSKAVANYRSAIQTAGPNALFAQSVVANAMESLGEDRAPDYFREQEPEPSLARANDLLLATMLPRAGKYSEGASLLDRLVQSSQSDEERAMLHLLYGTAADRAEEYETAKAQYEQALELQPTNWVACNNLAYLLSDRMGRHQDAEPYADRAVELRPETPHVLDTQAAVLIGQGEFGQAVGILAQALAIDPTFIAGHVHMADAYRRMGAFDSAEAKLNEVAELIGQQQQPDADMQERVENLRRRVAEKDTEQ